MYFIPQTTFELLPYFKLFCKLVLLRTSQFLSYYVANRKTLVSPFGEVVVCAWLTNLKQWFTNLSNQLSCLKNKQTNQVPLAVFICWSVSFVMFRRPSLIMRIGGSFD